MKKLTYKHLPTPILTQARITGLDPADYGGLTIDDISDRKIRKFLAAMRWQEDHIAERCTYSDPVWREVLRDLGSWQPKRGLNLEDA